MYIQPAEFTISTMQDMVIFLIWGKIKQSAAIASIWHKLSGLNKLIPVLYQHNCCVYLVFRRKGDCKDPGRQPSAMHNKFWHIESYMITAEESILSHLFYLNSNENYGFV